MDWLGVVEQLTAGLGVLVAEPGRLMMMAAGVVLVILAIAKEYEPLLLLPIGVGCILTNIPLSGMGIGEHHGLFDILYNAGILNELFPLLVFIGVGAMTDFGPLLENPEMALLGAAGQFGIFGALVLATLLGFDINEAVSIGIIGSADGPTSIYVTGALAPHLLGPVAVAAYSYMSLVPVLKPPVMRLLTTPAQRRIHMPYTSRPVSRLTRLLFPLVVTLIAGLLVPLSTPLISMLMFGNLLREAGVVERLNRAAQNELADVITIFLGLAVGATMTADQFLQWRTLGILAMGAVAFILDTAGGVLAGQALRILTRNRFNPLIGAAGISAFPMSARVVHRLALEEDPSNFLLMHAMGANTAGQIASVMAGGVVLALLAGGV